MPLDFAYIGLREKHKVIYNKARMTKYKPSKKTALKKKTAAEKTSVVCFNKDCKLRKQKSCRGFEACPGFQGK